MSRQADRRPIAEHESNLRCGPPAAASWAVASSKRPTKECIVALNAVDESPVFERGQRPTSCGCTRRQPPGSACPLPRPRLPSLSPPAPCCPTSSLTALRSFCARLSAPFRPSRVPPVRCTRPPCASLGPFAPWPPRSTHTSRARVGSICTWLVEESINASDLPAQACARRAAQSIGTSPHCLPSPGGTVQGTHGQGRQAGQTWGMRRWAPVPIDAQMEKT